MSSISNTIVIGNTKFHFKPMGSSPGTIKFQPIADNEIVILMEEFTGTLAIQATSDSSTTSTTESSTRTIAGYVTKHTPIFDLTSPSPLKSSIQGSTKSEKKTPLKAKFEDNKSALFSPMDEAPGSLSKSAGKSPKFILTPEKIVGGSPAGSSDDEPEFETSSIAADEYEAQVEEGVDFFFEETQQEQFDFFDVENVKIED
jgi:hypothetical protein